MVPELACIITPAQLLEAKLKRVYAEGAAARAAGRSPLSLAPDDEDACAGGGIGDFEAELALADAAMAALLEEVEGYAASRVSCKPLWCRIKGH